MNPSFSCQTCISSNSASPPLDRHSGPSAGLVRSSDNDHIEVIVPAAPSERAQDDVKGARPFVRGDDDAER